MPSELRARRELAGFLRNRRQRIDPGQVGLPHGPRRRISGLRREEVAVLAGVSPTWYAYLEQARDVQPSPEVLDSLARVLRLTEDERRYMHLLVHGRLVRPHALPAEITSAELAGQLVALSSDGPLPVYAVDHHWDVLAWNRAATGWYTDFARLAVHHRNLLRWMLSDPAARHRLPDWEHETRNAVARWRAMVARWGHDDRIDEQIAEYGRLSPCFARWWDDHDVQEHRSRVRRFRYPGLVTTSLRLVVTEAPELGSTIVVFHLPVD